MNLFENLISFYWVFKLHEYFLLKFIFSRFASCTGPVTQRRKKIPLKWLTVFRRNGSFEIKKPKSLRNYMRVAMARRVRL